MKLLSLVLAIYISFASSSSSSLPVTVTLNRAHADDELNCTFSQTAFNLTDENDAEQALFFLNEPPEALYELRLTPSLRSRLSPVCLRFANNASVEQRRQLGAMKQWLKRGRLDLIALEVSPGALLIGLEAQELDLSKEAALQFSPTLTNAGISYRALIVRTTPAGMLQAVEGLTHGAAKSWAAVQSAQVTDGMAIKAVMEKLATAEHFPPVQLNFVLSLNALSSNNDISAGICSNSTRTTSPTYLGSKPATQCTAGNTMALLMMMPFVDGGNPHPILYQLIVRAWKVKTYTSSLRASSDVSVWGCPWPSHPCWAAGEAGEQVVQAIAGEEAIGEGIAVGGEDAIAVAVGDGIAEEGVAVAGDEAIVGAAEGGAILAGEITVAEVVAPVVGIAAVPVIKAIVSELRGSPVSHAGPVAQQQSAEYKANLEAYNRQLTAAHNSRLGGQLRGFNGPPQPPPHHQQPAANEPNYGPVVWPTDPATRQATVNSPLYKRWLAVPKTNPAAVKAFVLDDIYGHMPDEARERANAMTDVIRGPGATHNQGYGWTQYDRPTNRITLRVDDLVHLGDQVRSLLENV